MVFLQTTTAASALSHMLTLGVFRRELTVVKASALGVLGIGAAVGSGLLQHQLQDLYPSQKSISRIYYRNSFYQNVALEQT